MARSFPGGNRRRKSLPLDGSVPGLEYNQYHAGHNHTPFDTQMPIDSPHTQEEYEPDPGKPEFPQSSYEPYEPGTHHHSMPALRLDPVERPSVPVEGVPTYKDGVRFQRLLDEVRDRPSIEAEQDPGAATESSGAPQDLGQIVHEAFQPDPAAEMISGLEQPQQIEDQSAPPPPDPYQEQQQMLDEEMMRFMDPFAAPGPGPMM